MRARSVLISLTPYQLQYIVHHLFIDNKMTLSREVGSVNQRDFYDVWNAMCVWLLVRSQHKQLHLYVRRTAFAAKVATRQLQDCIQLRRRHCNHTWKRDDEVREHRTVMICSRCGSVR